jgi:two-component system sensor histidine kinase RegB
MTFGFRLSGRLDGTPGEAESLGMAVIRPEQIDEATPGSGVAESIQDITKRKNLLLLVALRWIAVAGQIAAIFVAKAWLSISLPLVEMGYVLLFLVALNLISFGLLRSRWVIDEKLLFTALLLDVAALTAQLYLSGGAVNPFVSLFLLQVILGAVLLPTTYVWALAGLAGLSFLWLIRYHRPMDLTAFGLGAHGQSSYLSLHLYGMFLCFLLAAGLTVLFVTRITANLRDRDRLLSNLQQRSVEEEHIVRMGLLASGAAHELGTPLATVSVILNDWEHMAGIASDPSLSADLKEVRGALARCKDIVSGILLAAGEARGEDAERTTLSAFLSELFEQWRQTRAPVEFEAAVEIGRDVPIVAETVVRQTLLNMLDNALEASPAWVGVKATLNGYDLLVTVRDRGPGFAPRILADLGKPYNSTKGRPGSGLGLFLVVNVLRKLGGALTVRNLAEGGASAEVTLPLAALEIPDEQ